MNPFRIIRGESPECESIFGRLRLAVVFEKSVYMDIAKSALFKQILPAIGQFFFGLKGLKKLIKIEKTNVCARSNFLRYGPLKLEYIIDHISHIDGPIWFR